MTPERVYALLVEANPVPEPDAYLEAMIADQGSLRLVDSRRDNMKTQEPIRELTPESPAKGPWIAAVAAAIAIVLAIGVVAWLAGGGDGARVVDEPPPTTAAPSASPRDAALAATEQLFAAVATGDIDEIARITTLNGELPLAERRQWGFTIAMVAAGYGAETGECTAALSADETVVTVSCPMMNTDPVLVAMGMTDVVVSFDYLPVSGVLRPGPTEGANFTTVNQTIVDYLTAFYPEDYAAACNPAAYDFLDVVQDQGMSITPECAELVIPLLGDMASWIEAGQPAAHPEVEALAATDAFFAALRAGDIDGVAQVVIPGGELADSERRMWQFNMVSFAAGYQGDVGECTATHDTAANRVAVACPWTVGDPVFLALGITELEWPFDYFVHDGRLAWRPFRGADVSQANQATADFLDAFYAEKYAAACDPAAYNFQGIVFDRGLAFTPECAELLVPLLGDVAAWIESGQPATG